MIRKIASIIISAVAVIAASVIFTGDTAKAEYFGARWDSNSVCIQNQLNNTKIRTALVNSIVRIRSNTDIRLVNYGSSDCKAAGYENIIYAQDSKYGLNHNWVGRAVHFSDFTWGQTPNGKWTWLFNRNTLQFNESYISSTAYNTVSDWERVTAHELLHALGLGHNDDTCNSVMTANNCRRLMYPTTVDYREIIAIYDW